MSAIRRVLSSKQIHRKIQVTLTAADISTRDNSTFILHSDLPEIQIPKISVDEYVFQNAHKWPNYIATECGITGRKYTYEEVQRKASNLSRALRKKLKLEKGEVLAVLLPNTPEFSIVALGALKAGLVVTTLNPIYTPEEISRQLSDSAAKVIVTLNELYPLARASANLIKKQIPVLTIKTLPSHATAEGSLSFDEFTANIDFPDLPPAKHSDLAFLPYSSGTTGLPKGVRLTHQNIVSNLMQIDNRDIGVIEDTTNDHQDVLPAILPKFHIYGLVCSVFLTLYRGCRTVALMKFTPELYLDTLRKYKPDVLFLAPPIVLFLASHPSVTSEDLRSVRVMVSGAAPLGSLDEERFLQKAQKHITILQGYGLTETSPLVAITRHSLKKIPSIGGSIGRPVANTSVKIVNPDDPERTPLGPNKVGEMLIRGPQVMEGYHNQPDQTQDVLVGDGWLRTGDMAYYNHDNLLYVTDRLKELIKVKGFQVAPAELEEIIRDFPDVADAAVIGIPHPTQGEVPRAYIVQKSGRKVDVSRLAEYVGSKVAEYKKLKGGIEIVDAIPKNATGKIMRRALKQQYENAVRK